MLRRKKRTFVDVPVDIDQGDMGEDVSEKKHEKVDSDEELERDVLGMHDPLIGKLDAEEQTVPSSSDDEGPEEISVGKADRPKKAVWEDEDDKTEAALTEKKVKPSLKDVKVVVDATEHTHMRKKRMEKALAAHITPSWADLSKLKAKKKRLDSDSDDEAETNLTRRTGAYVTGSLSLPKGTIECKYFHDVAMGNNVQKRINSVEFHREARVLLVAGQTQQLGLYKIENDESSLLQSVVFEKFPIYTARYNADGSKIIASSKFHSHLFVYDLMQNKIVKIPPIRGLNVSGLESFVVSPFGRYLALTGRFGQIHILSSKSFEWICNLKLNADVRSLDFSKTESNILFAHSGNGEVYRWNVDDRHCECVFSDEGCIQGSSIAASKDGLHLACGSSSGVVNVYDMPSVRDNTQPTLTKTFMNLITEVDILKFSKNSEILCMASSFKDTYARLVHMRSLSVFQNFPSRADPLRHMTSADFSTNDGYACFGTSSGQALLYRLNHYKEF